MKTKFRNGDIAQVTSLRGSSGYPKVYIDDAIGLIGVVNKVIPSSFGAEEVVSLWDATDKSLELWWASELTLLERA